MGYFNSKKTKWRGKMNYNDMIYLQHYGVSIQKIKEMDTVTTETLAEAIEKEKKYPIHKRESDLQDDIVSLLDELEIDYHPSMSGLKKGSWGQIRFMKKQGIRKGHADLTIEEPIENYQILFIELKTVYGKLKDYQKVWLRKKKEQGYAVSVSYGFFDTLYKIKKYLLGEPVIWEEKGE